MLIMITLMMLIMITLMMLIMITLMRSWVGQVNCLVDLHPITSGAGWVQEGHPARKKVAKRPKMTYIHRRSTRPKIVTGW